MRKKKGLPPVPAPAVVTRDAAAARAVSGIYNWANHARKSAQDQIGQWKAKFDGSPAFALEWSRETFESAARNEVTGFIITMIDELQAESDEYSPGPSWEKILRTVRSWLYQAMVHGAKYPQHSTSPMSDEMSRCKMAQHAEWFERFDQAISALPS